MIVDEMTPHERFRLDALLAELTTYADQPDLDWIHSMRQLAEEVVDRIKGKSHAGESR